MKLITATLTSFPHFPFCPLELVGFRLILSVFHPALSIPRWTWRFCLKGGQKDGVIPLPASNMLSYNLVAIVLTPYPEQDDGEGWWVLTLLVGGDVPLKYRQYRQYSSVSVLQCFFQLSSQERPKSARSHLYLGKRLWTLERKGKQN